MKNLETKRLILRRWQSEDVQDLYEYAKNPEVGHMAGWEPHTDIGMSQTVLKQYMESDDVWAVALRENGKVIGHIKLTPDEDRGKYVARYISYALSADYWGKGYMTEAVKAVIRYVFEESDEIDMLSAFHSGRNHQSKRVIEKCGFEYDCTIPEAAKEYNGQLTDHICYHLLREEYFSSISEQ